MTTKANTNSDAHQHNHNHGDNSRPHPLTQFFGCCLGDDPAPLSPKIQSIRENLENGQIEDVIITPGGEITISKDMIVADILANFPQTKSLFHELHPLGLMSPVLDQISLEIFFSDQPELDLENICLQLESIVNQSQ
jgi:hypothetical protein